LFFCADGTITVNVLLSCSSGQFLQMMLGMLFGVNPLQRIHVAVWPMRFAHRFRDGRLGLPKDALTVVMLTSMNFSREQGTLAPQWRLDVISK
jgi:hypothetical protein